ncbi:hypothetical protein FOCG_13806 [Fusarium oxysporum f. sp. radicis-lycopersici 26381]|nr:hypothetical protein FOWG_09550 [Fusarium oxysporum f. sp. lycopersici MN25]EXL45031.1 hypothetical protein FOCG_13806 [Fusarium oxysporum f. sp. radicis-lycopersici 26381]
MGSHKTPQMVKTEIKVDEEQYWGSKETVLMVKLCGVKRKGWCIK